jgi:hypothetical protein
MVNLAGIFGAALSPIYDAATLHRRGPAVYDVGGRITAPGPGEFDCRVQIEAATEAMRADKDFAETDMRLLLLTASCSSMPVVGDEVAVRQGHWAGTKWSVKSRGSDPANGAWEMRGRKL